MVTTSLFGLRLTSLFAIGQLALALGATGCLAEADPDDLIDEPAVEDDQAVTAGVPLRQLTFRITDDVPVNLVSADEPGRTMDAAGNATETWVYGQTNVVGACRNLGGKLGVSEHELFSGGTCVQVGSFGTTFRVQDQLEDGQGCGDANKQHLDVHRKAFDGLNSYMKTHGDDLNIHRVSCGGDVSSTRVIFRSYDPSSDKHKLVHFSGVRASVKSVTLSNAGKTVNGSQQSGGGFLFEDFSGANMVGKRNVTLTFHDNSRQTVNIDFPSAGAIKPFEVKGNDVQRGGLLDLLELHNNEALSTATARAKNRQACINFLKSNPDAKEATARSSGHCAP